MGLPWKTLKKLGESAWSTAGGGGIGYGTTSYQRKSEHPFFYELRRRERDHSFILSLARQVKFPRVSILEDSHPDTE